MSECINWHGQPHRNGYARVQIRGVGRLAHRHVWEECFGTIPDGAFVLHSCDNRRCVNPEHLRLGSHLDNMRDMVERSRQVHGERHHSAHLTTEQVAEIKRRYVRYSMANGSVALGREFGVAGSAIRQIVAGRTWRAALQESVA